MLLRAGLGGTTLGWSAQCLAPGKALCLVYTPLSTVWLLFQNARGLTENSLPVVLNIPDPPLKHTGCHLTVPPERNKRTPGWLNLLRVRLRLRS